MKTSFPTVNRPLRRLVGGSSIYHSPKLFPVGSLIRLEPRAQPQRPDIFQLEPWFGEKNHQAISVYSYIVKSKKLVQYIDQTKQWARFVPIKFRNKNEPAIMGRTKPLPDFGRHYLEELQKRIEKGIEFIEKQPDGAAGIRLKAATTPLTVEGPAIELHLPFVKQEIFVPFSHTTVCGDILSYYKYVS